MRGLIAIVAIVLLLQACSNKTEVMQMGDLKIGSSSFENNGMIPAKFTCDGDNVNPALFIGNIPSNAKSLVLIVDDPDAPAGTWVHWVLWNVPLVKRIDENSVPPGAVQGMNDFKRQDYGGPCPPSGTHRYFFKLYALDTMLDIEEDSEKEDVEKAMEGHIISQTQIVGLYKR
jgi:Raf kinase inhibitor-like YbhB/YbcL family protein